MCTQRLFSLSALIAFVLYGLLVTHSSALRTRRPSHPPINNPSGTTIRWIRLCAVQRCTRVPGYPAKIRSTRTSFGSSRVTQAACANITTNMLRNHPSRARTTQQNFVRAIGLSSDQAGHIFARRFNAPPGLWNMFPVSMATNNGVMSSVESQIAGIVRANGRFKTEVCVRFRYGATGLRPVTIFMSSRNRGGTTVWSFNN